jgi:RNA polymerase sigma-70 factor, ECF subfamily
MPSKLLESASDYVLLSQIAAQNQEALSILYDRYSGLICGLAYKILGNTEEAEEVVIDLFTQVWHSAAKYDHQKGRVDSWLMMITRSRALDRWRSLNRSVKVVSAAKSELQINNSSPDPISFAIILERRELVKAAIAQLPPEQLQAIEMAYYGGMTHTEIALHTGKSLGTIKTRIRLGLNKLRQILPSE